MSALLERPPVLPDVGDGPAAHRPPEPGPRTPARLARAAALVAVLALLVAAIASIVGDRVTTTLPRGAVAVLVDGAAEIVEAEGWRTLAVGDAIPDEGRVRAVDGVARLEVAEGELLLASGTHLRLGDGSARLERGSVVTIADTRTVRAGAVTVIGQGTWRVDDGGQPRVAAYEGEATVDDGATTTTVPRLRQVTVRDGALAAARVLPLRYLASDPFDADLLAEALRVDALATSLSRSLASAHGTEPRELDFYAAFVAVGPVIGARLRDAAPDVAGDRFGPPSDVLLTAVAIDAIVTETARPRTDVTDVVVDLRRDGATWGLVALDAGVDAAALSAAAERALARADADPPPPATPETPTDDDTAGDAPPTEGAPGPAPGGGDPGPAPGGGTGPDDGATDPGQGGGDDDDGGLLRPVEDLLRDTGSGLADVVEDTTDGLGDVVGGVDDLLSPGGLLGR